MVPQKLIHYVSGFPSRFWARKRSPPSLHRTTPCMPDNYQLQGGPSSTSERTGLAFRR